MIHEDDGDKKSASILQGKRVVIVEDEGMTQLQLRRILTREGMLVVGAAPNGQAGIEIVLRERPDLVLMDIKMPGEINGLDAAEAILQTYVVCIVMLTAYATEEYLQRAQNIGACGYVVKPVTADALIPPLKTAYRQWQQLPN